MIASLDTDGESVSGAVFYGLNTFCFPVLLQVVTRFLLYLKKAYKTCCVVGGC